MKLVIEKLGISIEVVPEPGAPRVKLEFRDTRLNALLQCTYLDAADAAALGAALLKTADASTWMKSR